MNYNVIPAFPSPVIMVDVEEDTSELLEHDQYSVSHEQKDDYEKPVASQRVLEKYPKTKEILLNKFISVAEEVLGYKKRNYTITTSWFTLNNKGEGSQLHKHKNSFWSCVYYYQEEYPEGTGQILFDNPNVEKFDFYFSAGDIKEINNNNSLSCVIPPQPNLLLIFPSYLQHQILTHKRDQHRSSLAFNIVPLGSWGDGDSSFDQSWVTPTIGSWKNINV
tara:strand:+ start:257 stop:916 length:660 start_codon:yes stop_codon:yes gene_type:complete